MATEYSGTAVEGWFKDTFASKIGDLVPEEASIYRSTPFEPNGKRPGELFSYPVLVQADHGVTEMYGANAMTGFTLNNPVAAQVKEAQLLANAFVSRGRIPYMVAARAIESASFGTAKDFVAWATEGLVNRIEIQMLHGGRELGIIESVGTASGAVLPDVKITQASFAAGIWARSEGAQFDAYDTTLATKRNVNPLTLSVFDEAARDFTLTGTVAGDVDDVVATDKLFYIGTKGNQPTGLIGQIATTTGTIFNIAKQTYNLWRGNSYAVSGPLSLQAVLKALGMPRMRGLSGDVVAYINPEVWEDMNGSEAALRVYDSSYKGTAALNGVNSIEYKYQGGTIYVVSHAFMKQSEGLILPKDKVVRIGSTEPTANIPGRDGPMIVDVTDAASYEFRLFADILAFCKQPAGGVYLSGITLSS